MPEEQRNENEEQEQQDEQQPEGDDGQGILGTAAKGAAAGAAAGAAVGAAATAGREYMKSRGEGEDPQADEDAGEEEPKSES
jgi:hypothetical protein